jgi:proline dehydrogenase
MIPPIVRRFVAGETAATALDHARSANADGIGVILNLLGEHHDDPAAADADTETYLRLIEDVATTDLDVRVSVKPSQLGLDVSQARFAENYRRIVDAGADHGVFVWCDMEDSMTTDATIDAFEAATGRNPWGVGLCLQANLRRTDDDIDRLLDVPGAIRLVKGAYDEPAGIAYTETSAVNDAYRRGLDRLFSGRDRGIAVGSHDPAMVSRARGLADEHGSDYEVQMLMGVREAAQRDLAAQGVTVRQYAPYGDAWFAYFSRRIRESRGNALFALRAVLGR